MITVNESLIADDDPLIPGDDAVIHVEDPGLKEYGANGDMWMIAGIYLIFINLASLVLFYSDKKRARKHEWRIPEKTLFLAAAAGGSVGAIAGMYLFRHKTRHWYFVIGMPLILAVQVIAAWLYFTAR